MKKRKDPVYIPKSEYVGGMFSNNAKQIEEKKRLKELEIKNSKR
jgi:hypothetical protein